MKRLLVFAISICLVMAIAGPVAGQVPTYQIRYGAALPAVCTPGTGDIFYVNAGATLGLYQCTAANTWTAVGSQGTGNIFLGGNGAVGAPTFAFASDATTGLYRVGAGQVGVAIAGALTTTFSAASITMAAGVRLDMAGVAFAALGAPGNGQFVFCSDCTVASPCAGGGTGALAKRLNGAWVCN